MKELAELLRRERKAIARIDLPALAVIAEEKEVMLAAMRSADPPVARETLEQIVREAEINFALLGDAIDAVKETLGLSDRTGLYDMRARVRSGARSVVGRSA